MTTGFEEIALTAPMPEPVDIGDILAAVMPAGWHELPLGKAKPKSKAT